MYILLWFNGANRPQAVARRPYPNYGLLPQIIRLYSFFLVRWRLVAYMALTNYARCAIIVL